ncbi:MAG TPA: Clp protease N-terminal domain-containing protein [Solirubrobacteraceae bacterium]|nr:Clp protease N-terminal domain-containing protein [Solirubrobacteraceae bacterium]
MEDFAGKQFTPRVTRIFEATVRAAEPYGHSYIGTEHLLLGLLSESCGIAGQVLTKLGVADEAARK